MDNLDLYLYILIGIIYLVSRMLKAQKKVAPQKPPRRMPESMEPASETSVPKPFSFEDLLKEFERHLHPQEQQLEGPQEEEVYERKPSTQPQATEYEYYPGSTDYKTYEAKSLESDALPMYYQESELAEISGQAERTHKTVRKKRNFGSLLRKPGSLRDAIVLSEVLARKDF